MNEPPIEVEIILPECSDDEISEGLRDITRALDPKILVHGVLGGEHGYGADFENDVFKMHYYCWCESEDCPWCGETNAPNFLHKPSGSIIHWYKYIGRGMEVKLKAPWKNIEKECIASLAKREEL